VKYLLAVVVLLALIVLLFSACTSNKFAKYEILQGKELEGKIRVYGEPDKKIRWNIVSDNEISLEIKIMAKDDVLYSSPKLKDEFKTDVSNTELMVKVINKSGKDISFDGTFNYLYTGMAPNAVTVTKNIRLQ